MKKYHLRLLGVVSIILLEINYASGQDNSINAQNNDRDWHMGGNQATNTGSTVFGTNFNQPIYIHTGGTTIGQFTVNNGFGTGDGLLIYNPSTPGFDLDMWADNGASLGTHIRWGGSGLIEGANSRFEINGNYNGLAFFARQTTFPAGGLSIPRIIFYMQPIQNGAVIEKARFGNTAGAVGFFRVGDNPTLVDPVRRMEVFDNAAVPQFRITQTQSTIYTDMQTTALGDFIILPHNSGAANVNRFVGIQTATPGNTLEINSQAAGPTVLNGISPGSSGFSGLRFSDLRYNSSVPAAPQNDQGVLSVDANGDVVYIKAPNGLGTCNNPTTLTSPTDVIMNNMNVRFEGQGIQASRFGIGYTCSTPIPGKFSVLEANGVNGGTIGAYILNTNNASSATTYGMQCISLPNNPNPQDVGYVAGYFHATASKTCIAVQGVADGLASNGTANYGGYFVAQNGGNNEGIHAFCPTNQNGFAGYFDGHVNVSGDIDGTGNFNYTSDQMFKTNVTTISNASSIIASLQPKSYFFDTTNVYGLNFNSRKQYGFIAQDVQPILPELVTSVTKVPVYDTLGNIVTPGVTYLALNYNALFGIIVKAMQEEQTKTDSLLNVIGAMQSQMSTCCESNARAANADANSTDVHLANS
ncbi:MAG TPA: tail fiber domain-containing protein, partial [Bacteroidia bacterium]|nr:tail fiber domain-containing protein [Bacteroidia bacterium]